MDEHGSMFFSRLFFNLFLFSWDTTQESLFAYFSQFGQVIDCVVMKNSGTNRSRGFGFVTFADPSNIESVLSRCPHSLDGRTIDPKACNPRSMQKPKKSNGFPKVLQQFFNKTEIHVDYCSDLPRNCFLQHG